MKPLLTIMLPTTIDRREQFKRLYAEIYRQIIFAWAMDKVEVLVDEDNKEISIGAKRQRLLERALGEYVVGIDSDDGIAPTYVADILKALEDAPGIDHVGFYELCTFNGMNPKKSIFSIVQKRWGENVYGYDYIRCANPKSVIRRVKALEVGFQDLRYGEDILFSESVTALLSTEVFVDKILYYYRYADSEHNERYGIT